MLMPIKIRIDSHKERVVAVTFMADVTTATEEFQEVDLTDAVAAQQLSDLARRCFNQSCESGFWNETRNMGEMIALMHSELSEVLEVIRSGNPLMSNLNPRMSEHVPSITALAEEFADLFIRMGDFCAGFDIDLGEAVILKMQFNATRPHKHGKEF